MRGLLTQIHPALERVIGPRLDHPAVLELLQHPSPDALRHAGQTRIGNLLVKRAPKIGHDLASQIVAALKEQTVVVAGTGAAGLVIPRLAEQLATLRRQRTEIGTEVERLVEAHPLHQVLTSMPESGSGPAPDSSPRSPAVTSTPPPTSPHTPALPRSADAPAP